VSEPLYDAIVLANEERRAKVKASSVALTKAREAPFSFYERDQAKAVAKQIPPSRPPEY
jgi:hypothetical protein